MTRSLPGIRRGYFVTGTDTGVGKTVVSAALVTRLRRPGRVRYWKPIQTGIERDDDTAEVRRLAACAPDEVLDEGVRLPGAVSPHLAAARQRRTIDVESLLASVRVQEDDCFWIVEGAGGALAPINDRQFIADLMAAIGLPAIVVARSALGTINHTLLTVECLRRRGIAVTGVVMVGPPDRDNREAIERYGALQVIGEMPRVDPLTPEALAAWAARALEIEVC